VGAFSKVMRKVFKDQIVGDPELEGAFQIQP